MIQRVLNLLRFQVGQLLLRSTLSRLLVVGGMVGGVAMIGGLVAFRIEGGLFESAFDAMWWAFLRLSDPGYLGDDEGFGIRAVSTVLTLLGYVIFLGALVAVMTQALLTGMRRLESGLTPIAARGHVLIAGWTDRTVHILREMSEEDESGQRWPLRGSSGIAAVVLAEEASRELHQTLRERLGRRFDEHEIILRQGEPIYLDHLKRGDFANASTIVLPGDPYLEEGTAHSDARNIKAMLAIGRRLGEQKSSRNPPLLVVELFDERRVPAALAGYTGPLEVVATGRLLGGMLVQALRYPGVARGFREMLLATDDLRLRSVAVPEAMVGMDYGELVVRSGPVSVLGLVRERMAHVLPAKVKLRQQDQLITFGRSRSLSLDRPSDSAASEHARPVLPKPMERLLILGWSSRVPVVLAHLATLTERAVEVEILSFVPVEERTKVSVVDERRLLRITHRLGDFTIPETVLTLGPETFDAVLLMASDRLESGAESDARTIAAHAVLLHCLADKTWPHTVVELMHAENAELLEGTPVEYLVAPRMVGRILAVIARSPRMRRAFDVLLSPGETEVVVVGSDYYGALPEGGSLRRQILAAGHVPLGILLADATGIRSVGDEAAPADAQILVVAKG